MQKVVAQLFALELVCRGSPDRKCRQWIIRTRRSDLQSLTSVDVRHRFICSEHFAPTAYNNPKNVFESSLRHDACPTLCIPNLSAPIERRMVSRTYNSPSPKRRRIRQPAETVEVTVEPIQDNVTLSSPIVEVQLQSQQHSQNMSTQTEEKALVSVGTNAQRRTSTSWALVRRLRKKGLQLKRSLLNAKASQKRLLAKLKNAEKRQSCSKCDLIQQLPTPSQNFIAEQISSHTAGKVQWSESSIKIGQCILYKSPASYEKFQEFFAMPSTTTLYRRSPETARNTGICFSTLSQLGELLSDSDPKENNLVLMFDAMHLRPHFNYNFFTDRISGVVSIDEETQKPEYAQALLVFMLRSICHGWSQIIGHHFTPSVFGRQELGELLEAYLVAMDVAGLNCKAVVCDQEPSHMSLFREAGVTPETPYIKCPSSGRKVYIIFDPPHLLKSARNNLISSDFLHSDGSHSSWTDLKGLFDLEHGKSLKRAPHLTPEHIAPSLARRMNVRLAAQVFSHRTASAMRSCSSDLPPSSDRTADTIELFNNMFDFVNSNNLHDKGTRRPALRQLWDSQLEDIQRWIRFISELRFQSRKTGTVKRTLPFKEGWLITLKSIAALITDFLAIEGAFFVLTRRLNQDPLEHVFSAIRAKGGFTNHPTVHQASGALRKIAANAFLCRGLSKHTNVEAEESVSVCPGLLHSGKPPVELPVHDEEMREDDSDSELPDDCEIPASNQWEQLADRDTMRYVTGAMVHRLACTDCSSLLLDDTLSLVKPRSFLDCMTFPGASMCAPKETVVDEFQRRLKLITIFINEHFHQKSIVTRTAMKFRLKSAFPACSQVHCNKLMTFFVRMLVRVFCKKENGAKNEKSRTKQKLFKLNV